MAAELSLHEHTVGKWRRRFLKDRCDGLLDEPLAALDLKLRQAMQEELRRIHQQIGGTFVFVTHDQGEALGLANLSLS